MKLSNYQIKRNKVTQEDEIHINKRTKLEDATDEEVIFDIKQEEKQVQDEVTCTLEELLQWETNTLMKTSGRITFQGPKETIQCKGKTLRKQEAALTDNTGTIRLVLWENDITKIDSGNSYDLNKVAVKRFQDTKYVTLNMKSTVNIADLVVDREDEVAEESNLNLVKCPADGVQSLSRYLSCYKCRAKIIPTSGKNLLKCSECGMAQLKTKSIEKIFANDLFSNAGEQINLMLFDDKLMQLYSIL